MIHWAWLILAFMLGGTCGILTLALVSANRYE